MESACRAGLHPVPVPVDGRGARTDVLGNLALDAVCVTPAHPQVRVRGIDAGLHLLLDVGSADERGLVTGLRCRGLQVRAAGDCRLDPAGPSGLLVGYGNPPEHRIPAVARAIAAALAGA